MKNGLHIWLIAVTCYGAGRLSQAYFQSSFIDAGLMTCYFALILMIIMWALGRFNE